MSSILTAYALNVTVANLIDHTSAKDFDLLLHVHLELLRESANFAEPEEDIDHVMREFRAAVLNRIAFLRLVTHPTAGRA